MQEYTEPHPTSHYSSIRREFELLAMNHPLANKVAQELGRKAITEGSVYELMLLAARLLQQINVMAEHSSQLKAICPTLITSGGVDYRWDCPTDLLKKHMRQSPESKGTS